MKIFKESNVERTNWEVISHKENKPTTKVTKMQSIPVAAIIGIIVILAAVAINFSFLFTR